MRNICWCIGHKTSTINKITVIMVLAGITGEQQSAHRPQGNRALPLKPPVSGGASRVREMPEGSPAHTQKKGPVVGRARLPALVGGHPATPQGAGLLPACPATAGMRAGRKGAV